MDIRNKIVEVETLDLKQLSVKKYRRAFEIYPWIKSRIFHKVMMGKEVLQEKNSSVLRTQLKSLTYGFFSLFRKYDAWAFSNSSERILIDGKYFDKVMDGIALNSSWKVLVVELQLFVRYRRKDVASKYVVSRAWFIFLEELYAKLFLRKINFEGREVLKQLEEILGEKVETEAIIRKYLAQYRIMKFFLAILPKPKVIFHTVSYANFGYIAAWKDKGIRVVEMQHGLIGDGHYGYVYHQEFDNNQFPDDVLVFGESDARFFETMTKFPLQQAIPVGRYVMDHFYQAAVPNRIPASRILVSLQDAEWSNALLRFVLQCNELTNEKIEWIIQTRRTPAEEYKKMLDFPANVTFSTDFIYEAIGKADAHLTIFSTTAIESLSLGKPTFLYNFEGAAKTYLGHFLKENPDTYWCDEATDFVHQWETLTLRSKEEIAALNSENISANYAFNLSAYLRNSR